MSRPQLAAEQIVFARNYTTGLLDRTPPTEWHRRPPGGVSHVAWQVGHLASSEYRLALWRVRGERPGDEALFPPEFGRLFGADSVPQADSSCPPAELRAVLGRVHQQVLRELPGLEEAELGRPIPHPHPFATTRLGRSCGAPTTRCCTPARSACFAVTWATRRSGEAETPHPAAAAFRAFELPWAVAWSER